VAAGGETSNGTTRFRRSQLALLDALLAVLPEVTVDETFERARAELRTFDRIAPADPPRSFIGTLRGYQRDGLGWLHFLRRFQLGGCLADDMGLGKTVQVLALLAARRDERKKAGTSIIVVPRSLVFNWLREAERFTPKLRVLDYSRGDRRYEALSDASADVVITTYGTVRRDAPVLTGIEFDYAILDEATAIKNARTATAKACRLLRSRHRLALTGTPVENRIEEVWSLLEFLNPGCSVLLPASRHSLARRRLLCLRCLGDRAELSSTARGGRQLLARALRPVILRRTKEQVAPELPERLEQTIEVELEPPQRRYYDALRESYRRSVLDRVDSIGLKRSRMHILEALLRLRQVACHPALADPRKAALPSAKLEALVPALQEVAAEGHKALVFSQFTTFLGLVQKCLDDAGIRYEYLDGRTRDRRARIDRFERDAACPVFLISLRAGGHGLNLTAADYVYILDPWWNPAVEAQAIDRAHRIGQTRRVIATRLVARDTIEGKILELQASKRALADAILAADQGMLTAIGRAELELLLS
jgi:SNF2 family DNA or RNA helicase